MRSEELTALLEARIFRPFRVNLSNGTSHDITNRDMAVADRSALRIHYSRAGGTMRSRGIVFVSLIHIVQIEMLVAIVPPSQN